LLGGDVTVQGFFRFFWPLLFLPLTFTAQSGQRTREENSSYRYGVEVDLVSLFATVHDPSGRLVTHLNEKDFILYDDGVRQNISQFSREYIPLSVLILLDTSGSMYGAKLENAKHSLIQFLRRLDHGDEAQLIAFQTRPRILQGFTPDLELIRRKLKQLEGNGSTALYDTILYALDQVRKSSNRRRALLLLSDGINTYGKAQLKDTIAQLRRQGVELFAIGIETDQPEEYLHRAVTRAVLNSLTESAGGEAFIVREPKELGKVCAMISDRMHNQYTLAYYPPKTNDARWRTIRVETRVPNLKVIPSKTGYYPLKPAP
jgi:Ca-activated chloride channel family protein